VASPGRGLPLAAQAGLAGLAAGLVPLAAATAGAALGAVAGAAVLGGLVGGVLAAVGAALLAAAAGGRLAAALRLLPTAAGAQTPHPGPAGSPPRRGGWCRPAELVELAAALDALQLRLRLSDEVAERHRRGAHRASAGVAELLSGLVAAEEGARGQLAAELHDTVAQSLAVARRLLAEPVTDGRGSPYPAGSKGTACAADLVEEAEEQVRAVIARSRPPALRDGDLARAVGQLRDDLEQRYGLRVRLSWPDAPHPLPLATAVTTYRFFQEALLNVVRHADVDEATAELSVAAGVLVAVVTDAGPGFDAGSRPAPGVGGRHVGLGLLRERARLAGGSLRVDSRPGGGTRLTLSLPAAGRPVSFPVGRAA
jgi:signal transduction histidine kinase